MGSRARQSSRANTQSHARPNTRKRMSAGNLCHCMGTAAPVAIDRAAAGTLTAAAIHTVRRLTER